MWMRLGDDRAADAGLDRLTLDFLRLADRQVLTGAGGMLFLLIFPVLVAGFVACQIHPVHSYRLHRYEGQYLYLKSAELGPKCFFLAGAAGLAMHHWLPDSITICCRMFSWQLLSSSCRFGRVTSSPPPSSISTPMRNGIRPKRRSRAKPLNRLPSRKNHRRRNQGPHRASLHRKTVRPDERRRVQSFAIPHWFRSRSAS